jgi:hypothetical protein
MGYSVKIVHEISANTLSMLLQAAIRQGMGGAIERVTLLAGTAPASPWFASKSLFEGDFRIAFDIRDEDTVELTPEKVQRGLTLMSTHNEYGHFEDMLAQDNTAHVSKTWFDLCLFGEDREDLWI